MQACARCRASLAAPTAAAPLRAHLCCRLVHSLPSHDRHHCPCNHMQPWTLRLPPYFCIPLCDLAPAATSRRHAWHFTHVFHVYTFGVIESKRTQCSPAGCPSQLVVNCALGHVARNLLLHTCTAAGRQLSVSHSCKQRPACNSSAASLPPVARTHISRAPPPTHVHDVAEIKLLLNRFALRRRHAVCRCAALARSREGRQLLQR